jgi:hypothetical protein
LAAAAREADICYLHCPANFRSRIAFVQKLLQPPSVAPFLVHCFKHASIEQFTAAAFVAEIVFAAAMHTTKETATIRRFIMTMLLKEKTLPAEPIKTGIGAKAAGSRSIR